jgi:hypothetical protein
MTASRIFQVLVLPALCGAPAGLGLRSLWATSKPSPDFVYLAEEAALVPGRENRMTARYLSEDGLTQCSEIVDNELALFEERQANVKTIFAALAPLISGDGFGMQKRSDSVSVVDGLYPPYERVFFRSKNKKTQLYGGLVSAAPSALADFVQQVRAICPAPSSQAKPAPAIFLQAALLDLEAANQLRKDRLLRVVTERELDSAPITAAAVHHPFQLIRIPASDTNDTFVTQLNSRKPVLDLEYAGAAFQLTCLKTPNPHP